MADTAESQRSYERNLGYARFWLGVGIAVLSLLFTFGYDLIFGDAGAGQSPTTAVATTPAPAWFALLALIVLAGLCLYLALYFRNLYRGSNADLVRIARNKRNHQPHQEEATQ